MFPAGGESTRLHGTGGLFGLQISFSFDSIFLGGISLFSMPSLTRGFRLVLCLAIVHRALLRPAAQVGPVAFGALLVLVANAVFTVFFHPRLRYPVRLEWKVGRIGALVGGFIGGLVEEGPVRSCN